MFGPFELLREYLRWRPNSVREDDPFFVFWNNTTVWGTHFRETLIKSRFNPSVYSGHSFSAGRARDLLKVGISIKTIKNLGRWKCIIIWNYASCENLWMVGDDFFRSLFGSVAAIDIEVRIHNQKQLYIYNKFEVLWYDTIGKIKWIQVSVLSIRDLNCHNNIQLFPQQCEKLRVNGDTN